jgi:hypothetical protein
MNHIKSTGSAAAWAMAVVILAAVVLGVAFLTHSPEAVLGTILVVLLGSLLLGKVWR